MPPDLEAVLRQGQVEVRGRLPWSSNATFLADICFEDRVVQAVYKPLKGERPLWDFPRGLYQREIAAYVLADALGWDIVPLTVERLDAPLGQGSLQLFVDAEFDEHYFTLYEDDRYHDQLRRICLFDIVANNTDRKSGHCLLDTDGHIWAIDNGLAFHEEFKLRTVIWEFAGEPLPPPLVADVERLVGVGVPSALVPLLDDAERGAILERARAVLRRGMFPTDPSGRRYPWPLV